MFSSQIKESKEKKKAIGGAAVALAFRCSGAAKRKAGRKSLDANEMMSRRRKATANNLKKTLTRMFTLLLPGSPFALPALISLEMEEESLGLIALSRQSESATDPI